MTEIFGCGTTRDVFLQTRFVHGGSAGAMRRNFEPCHGIAGGWYVKN
jgi:hypothetical protein